ncbi:LCP family protein [Acetobacterium woodii]|uniref:Cell envelope-like transcriptional attenuator protein n=1 Tax=Acetobacterium woodii (strain ATCC 29683 / DSM 1030 / JCM 2381 / KCTC 1655 / WB1) TaxID=931626 RepID=H6LGC2_ACEWD|nr:LCP family protein [Acetobacterium woodii]AFA47058.1 cell envelope-like transcriptional attenuator protein [Acetobacterium woodii DSM 1030]
MSNRKKNVIENRRKSSPKRESEENLRQNTNRYKKVTPSKSIRNETTRYEKTKPINVSAVRRKKRGFKNGLIKFLRTIFLIIIFLIATAFAANAFFLGNVTSDLKGNLSQYGINKEAAAFASQHKIVNVAVFGVDGRDDVEGDRTDTIMIATADYEHSKVKITSLMRDTYVYINDKYKYDKLNAAYAYGGPNLALQTINQNFDTTITDYITIDFNAMVSMVNAVGGVTINIKSEDELDWVNQYLMDVNEKVNTGSPDLEETGSQLVDGSQALAYCRVRYVGDGDFDRTLRQREVFEQVLSKALDLDLKDQYNLLMATLPYVKTSLSTTEMIKYALNLALMPSKDIEQSRFPADKFVSLDNIDGVSYVIPNTLVENIKALYQFIYETAYNPSNKATQISDDIDDSVNGSSSY